MRSGVLGVQIQMQKVKEHCLFSPHRLGGVQEGSGVHKDIPSGRRRAQGMRRWVCMTETRVAARASGLEKELTGFKIRITELFPCVSHDLCALSSRKMPRQVR